MDIPFKPGDFGLLVEDASSYPALVARCYPGELVDVVFVAPARGLNLFPTVGRRSMIPRWRGGRASGFMPLFEEDGRPGRPRRVETSETGEVSGGVLHLKRVELGELKT